MFLQQLKVTHYPVVLSVFIGLILQAVMTNRCFKCHPSSHRCLYQPFCLYECLLSWIWTQKQVFSVWLKLTAVFGLLYSCVTGVKKKSLCIWDRRMPLMTWRERRRGKKMGHLFISLKICFGGPCVMRSVGKVGPVFCCIDGWNVPSVTVGL